MAQVSTSPEETDQSQLQCAVGPTQDRRPPADSGDAQDGREAGGGEDDGSHGDEDDDKGEDEFEREDEELLRALMRCHPYLLTFGK